MKQIVYTVIDSGIDGRAPSTVLYAAPSEEERDRLLNSDPSKMWRATGEQIVDLEVARKAALAKLNGIDRLALGLPNWLEERK